MKTLYSFLAARRLALIVTTLVVALLALFAEFRGAWEPLTVIVGMSWLTDDVLVTKLLASRGLVSATTGLLTPIVNVLAKTADYTILGTEGTGTVFTTRGAAGAVIFTLPAPSLLLKGTRYRFKNVVDQNMSVKTATADTLITFNDLTADSLDASTVGQKIGAEIEAFCDGTSWFASGVSVGHTFTVVT